MNVGEHPLRPIVFLSDVVRGLSHMVMKIDIAAQIIFHR